MRAPADLFREWLGKRPKTARIGIAIDSDRLLAESRVLDRSTVVDPDGHEWQLVVFRGDDLAFRLRFREATKQDRRTVVVLTRGAETEQRINISTVSDLLALNEAGMPLDLSLGAYFQSVSPKIHFPIAELRRFKDELLERLDLIPAAAAKLIERWGKPDSWGRPQVAAMVILAYHPELSLSDIWRDETTAESFLPHVLRLLVATPKLRPQLAILRNLIKDVAREQVESVLFWTEVEPDELAAYLVLRDFAGKIGLQNPATQLAGIGVFSSDLPLQKLESSVEALLASLRGAPAVWNGVQRAAEVFLTPQRVAKVQGLLSKQQPAALAEVCPLLLQRVLISRLGEFLKEPSLDKLSWVAAVHTHPILESRELTDRGRQCQAAVKFALSVEKVERLLAKVAPEFSNADALLDWFLHHQHHTLELEVAQAGHHLDAVGEDTLQEAALGYLGDDLDPAPSSLKGRVVARLGQLDLQLADFVRESPEAFMLGARSVRTFIRDQLDVTGLQLGTLEGRVWILVFDGMRFDTWDRVIKPVLAESFEITESARFAMLPSFTAYARTALLAGRTPSNWKGFKGDFNTDEAQLFAVSLGLTAAEAKEKVRFVKEAETTKARAKWAQGDAGAKPVNVLIYAISDDECHAFKNDLAAFNGKIRSELVGNKQDGIRGIIDDLLRRIQPQDTVLLTSDHGFVELLNGDAITIAADGVEKSGKEMKSVKWRYIEGFAPAEMPAAIPVTLPQGSVWMAVGRRWFKREDGPMSSRFAHGGISLAELVVPGVVLHRVTEKVARIELEDAPVALNVDEDAFVEMRFALKNGGNQEAEFQVQVVSNLGEPLWEQQGKLAAAARLPLTVQVEGKYRTGADQQEDTTGTLKAVTVRLRHTALDGKWRESIAGPTTIPVKVNPKKTKLDVDALKSFDDL